MQAYKVKGKLNEAGELILSEPIALSPGEVEVIVVKTASMDINRSLGEGTQPEGQVNCEIPSLKQCLENAPPVPPDFDPDQAKWEYLKEKHNL